MKKIFITATNTDIGKTYITLKLMEHLSKLGLKVASFKPIETGVEETPIDGLKHLSLGKRLNPKLATLTIDDIVPVTFAQPAAPFIASDMNHIDTKPIFEALKKFENRCDILLIEGAGGLYVPIDKEYYMIDLIEDLQVDLTLLVTHCSLGCINDTILSQNALKARELPFETIFNCKEKNSFEQTSKPYFDAVGEKIVTIEEMAREIVNFL